MKRHFGGKSGSRRHSTTGFGTKLSNFRSSRLIKITAQLQQQHQQQQTKEVNRDLINLTLLLKRTLFLL